MDTPSDIPSDDWAGLEKAIRAFEQAWSAGKRPAIEEYLPAAGAARRAVLVELVHAELECRLKAGEPARVESYLERFPELSQDRKVLLSLVSAEFGLRRRSEAEVGAEEYGRRFPQIAGELDGVLSSGKDGLPETLTVLPEQQPPAAANPELPGYDILGFVARGGMGAVYKARQQRLDRLVAIKILAPELRRHPLFAERFSREARALARLGHPHIIAVHDFGQAGDLYYLVTEFIDGPNLRRRIQAGKLPVHEVVGIVLQVCDALQYAHDEGVVHRDIKPENVLIDPRGRVKVADFGLAKLASLPGLDRPLTGTHQVMGTLHYMAPEQFVRPRDADHRADIYSLGVVLYEMLTGELPMGNFAPPSRQSGVDLRLDPVVLKMLEKDPERRYQKVNEVRAALAALDDLKPAGATAGPPSGLSTRFALAAGAVFLAGWIATAALANLGNAGLVAAGAVMAGVAFLVARQAVQRVPELDRELRQHGPAQGKVNYALALVLFGAGFAFLAEAHYGYLDRPGFDPVGYELSVRGAEQQVLQQLPEFKGQPPAAKLSGVRAGLYDSSKLAPWFALWGVLLAAVAFLALLETKMHRNSWALHWLPVVVLTAAFALPLPVAHALTWVANTHFEQREDGGSILAFQRRRVRVPVREVLAPIGQAAVLDRLRQWCLEHGYQLRIRAEWAIDTVPDRKRVADLSHYEAFEQFAVGRWQWTWRGAHRPTPLLGVRLLSSIDPVQTLISIDVGYVAEGSEEAELWRPVIDSLQAALGK